jgi:hypothetical protein
MNNCSNERILHSGKLLRIVVSWVKATFHPSLLRLTLVLMVLILIVNAIAHITA